ncbi:MAG: transposase, partial [Bacteroidales bacterium]
MSGKKQIQNNTLLPLDGIAGLIQNIAFIQTRIEDFIDEDGEAIEITDQQKFVKRKIAEYLGIEIPPEKLVINAKGCIAMAKPKCPNCGSLEIWENGTRKRKPQTITGTKIEIKIQKYQCAQCKKNFEPDITRYIQAYQRFTAEIQAFAVCLYNKGVSAEEIVEILYTMYNVTVTATTIRSWVKKLSGEIVVVENEEGLSDIFHFDEQRVMLDGKEHWRYTIIDTNG